MILIFFSCNSFQSAVAQLVSIPVTSSSVKAKSFFYQAFEAEDMGELEKASGLYQKAISLDSNFALAYMGLAMVQPELATRRKYMAKSVEKMSFGSASEKYWILARNAFYGVGRDIDEYVNFEKLLALHPNDPVAHYYFGFVHHNHGRKDYAKAIEHYENAIKLNPKYISPYIELAYAYMGVKDYKNAERILRTLIQLQPNKSGPVDSYAELLLRTGRYKESMEWYDKALKINPTYPWAIFGIAANLNFLGRHQEARNLIPKALQFKLNERESWHVMQAMECSYLDDGKPDSAVAALMQYAKLAKEKNYFTQQYIAYRNSTRIYFEYDDHIRGLKQYKLFNEFVQNNSQSNDVKKQVADLSYYYQAFGKLIEGKYTEAMLNLEEYTKRKGRVDDFAKILKAKILIKENKYDDAKATLSEADIDNPYVLFWLAEVNTALGNKIDALNLYKEVSTKNIMQDMEYHLVRRKALAKQ